MDSRPPGRQPPTGPHPGWRSAWHVAVAALALAASTPSPGASPLFVSSFGSGEVLRYDSASGAYVDTFIQSGMSGGLVEPHGLLDRGVDLLVASAQTDQVLRYDRTTGEYLGEFIGPASGIDYPVYMTVGGDGLLYISSQGNDSIRRFDLATGAAIDTLVPADSEVLDGPSGFAFADGLLYVAGRYSGNVVAYDTATGAVDSEVLNDTQGVAAGSTFGLQIGSDGDLYVASNGALRRWDLDTSTLSTVGTGFPIGIDFDTNGELVVATGSNLRRYDPVANSLSSPLLGAGGSISTLNFFHYSTFLGQPGDFNGDGSVNLADYTVWRNNLGSDHALAGGGFELGGSAGVVDEWDYWLWKESFGQAIVLAGSIQTAAVPEGSTAGLLIAWCMGVVSTGACTVSRRR
ncbi:DUF6923 family protein [Aeoliella sp.]|uniref:Vgb family protein n=1 Tax=Aeoliella sp. TaxID=2795800 RepID=UPI003CCB8BBA